MHGRIRVQGEQRGLCWIEVVAATEQQLQCRQRLNWFCGGLESRSETSSNRESFLK